MRLRDQVANRSENWAVATAKTLAQLKIELVGVSSLPAFSPRAGGRLVIPIMDARRNNVYAGFYQSGQAVRPEAHLPRQRF